MISKPWLEDQSNDPSFQADIYQVAMIAAFTIAILFMLGNTIPLDGKKKYRVETDASMKKPKEDGQKKNIKKRTLPEKTTIPKVHKRDKAVLEEPFALVFENSETLYDLMKRKKVRLFVMLPELNLQYRAIFKGKSDFDFQAEKHLSGFIYELTGASTPRVLSKSFKSNFPELGRKKLVFLIRVEKKLNAQFKKALEIKKGVHVITKDENVISPRRKANESK